MTKRLSKFLIVTLAICMVFGLAACGTKQPKTALELIEFNSKLTDKDNLRLTMNMSSNVSMADMPLFGDMAVEVKLNLESAIKGDKAKSAMDIEMMGEKTHADLFVDGKDMWLKADSDQWLHANVDDIDNTMTSFDVKNMTAVLESLDTKELFKDATMSYDANKKQYTVTIGADKLINKENNLLQAIDVLGSMEHVDEHMLEAFANAKAVYTFDATYHLVQFELTGFEYEYNEPIDDMFKLEDSVTTVEPESTELPEVVDTPVTTMTVKGSCTILMKFFDYGTVTDADVDVSTDIKTNAVEMDDVLVEPDVEEDDIPVQPVPGETVEDSVIEDESVESQTESDSAIEDTSSVDDENSSTNN